MKLKASWSHAAGEILRGDRAGSAPPVTESEIPAAGAGDRWPASRIVEEREMRRAARRLGKGPSESAIRRSTNPRGATCRSGRASM